MEEAFKEVIEYMNAKGFKMEEDYDIYVSKEGKDSYFNLNIPQKGNKRIIEDLKEFGWIERKRYRNDDGNASILGYDVYENHFEHSRVIIVISQKLDIEYIEAVNMIKELKDGK